MRNVLATIGDQSGRVRAGRGRRDAGSIYVQLVDLEERDFSQFDVMDDARLILNDYPDLRTSVQGINPLASGGARISDVELNLRGPDLARLQEYADRLMAGMRQMPGMVDVDTTLAVRTPELRLDIDREKASDLGLNVQDVASTVQTFIAGLPVSKFKEGDQQYDIWLRADAGRRRTPQDIADLTVPSRRGSSCVWPTSCGSSEAIGPAQIDRLNRQRSITIVANLQHDVPLADRRDAHREGRRRSSTCRRSTTSSAAAAPRGCARATRTSRSPSALASSSCTWCWRRSSRASCTPSPSCWRCRWSIPFALLSLIALGEPLNIYSTLGLFMLLGVVKKNGILQVDYTNTLRARGMERDAAILEANRVRLRPILMTTMMLVLGMIPIALGTGPGAGSRSSIAKVIVGGQRSVAADHPADHPGRILAVRRPGTVRCAPEAARRRRAVAPVAGAVAEYALIRLALGLLHAGRRLQRQGIDAEAADGGFPHLVGGGAEDQARDRRARSATRTRPALDRAVPDPTRHSRGAAGSAVAAARAGAPRAGDGARPSRT